MLSSLVSVVGALSGVGAIGNRTCSTEGISPASTIQLRQRLQHAITLDVYLQHHLFKSFRRKKKRSSRGSKSDKGSQEGMSDIVRMEELEEAERKAAEPRWRTRQFWHTAIPLFVSAVLLIVGTVLALKHYQTQVGQCPHSCWLPIGV